MEKQDEIMALLEAIAGTLLRIEQQLRDAYGPLEITMAQDKRGAELLRKALSDHA